MDQGFIWEGEQIGTEKGSGIGRTLSYLSKVSYGIRENQTMELLRTIWVSIPAKDIIVQILETPELTFILFAKKIDA